MENRMIVADNLAYSLDCYETGLNNNVLVVGSSGCGKTRSVVTPNLLEATGSYIISDPKGNLYQKYKKYLKEKGYVVKKLDFTDSRGSASYSFFPYIKDEQDIVKISHMLISKHAESKGNLDPFWDESVELLLQSIIGYLYEAWSPAEQNMHYILKLIEMAQGQGDMECTTTALDRMFKDLEKKNPNSFAVRSYNRFRIAANKTLRSILICANALLAPYGSEHVRQLTSKDTIRIGTVGMRKTAIFVVVSDTDRSLDPLVNLFFTQAMNELCYVADKKTTNYALPVPVRFILDDFATNCKIAQFPRMISSIRSRNISAMLMIQSEEQLEHCYGVDGKTIIANCDTYIYMGGNDVYTAEQVARRVDLPMKKILNMPVGTGYVFRRGQAPVASKNFALDAYLQELGIDQNTENKRKTGGLKRASGKRKPRKPCKDIESSLETSLENGAFGKPVGGGPRITEVKESRWKSREELLNIRKELSEDKILRQSSRPNIRPNQIPDMGQRSGNNSSQTPPRDRNKTEGESACGDSKWMLTPEEVEELMELADLDEEEEGLDSGKSADLDEAEYDFTEYPILEDEDVESLIDPIDMNFEEMISEEKTEQDPLQPDEMRGENLQENENGILAEKMILELIRKELLKSGKKTLEEIAAMTDAQLKAQSVVLVSEKLKIQGNSVDGDGQ